MAERLRVALLVESSRSFGRQLLKGIAAYGRSHGSWIFLHHERLFADSISPQLRQWKPHGIIARLSGSHLTRQIRRMKVPTVDLYPDGKNGIIPGVGPDPESLMRIAIDHFVERGFHNFAYCGFSNVPFSDIRQKCFKNHLAAMGTTAYAFSYPALPCGTDLATIEEHALRYAGSLAAWLRELPKPLAILACNDVRGAQILSVCKEAGISVPGQAAVLGIDNDDVHCELCDPPLSSITPNVEQIGYEAAGLLDRLIQGVKPPAANILVPARGVVVRHSTDVLAIDNEDAAEAIRFVREHACDGLAVEQITARMSVSLSTLDRWFEKYLGRSPTAEILRVQVQHVQELLRTTTLTLDEIAQRTGFKYVESMQRVFKRTVGFSPGSYRKQSRTCDT